MVLDNAESDYRYFVNSAKSTFLSCLTLVTDFYVVKLSLKRTGYMVTYIHMAYSACDLTCSTCEA